MVTVEDIIRAMEERPDVRERVRRAVLTDEVLDLPRLVASNAKAIEKLGVRIDANAIQIAKNTEAIEANSVQIAKNTAAIEKLTERVDANAVQIAKNTAAIEKLTERVDANAVQIAKNTAAIEKLAERVDANAVQIAKNTEAINRLTARVDALTGKVAENTSEIKRLDDRVGRVLGFVLEIKILQTLPPLLSQTIGLRRSRAMWAANIVTRFMDEFLEDLDEAEALGSITEWQLNRLMRTDLIVRAIRKSDGAPVWFAVESSGTIGRKDIERAPQSVAALKAVFGQDAEGVVLGLRIRDEDRRRAEESGLTVMIVDEDDYL